MDPGKDREAQLSLRTLSRLPASQTAYFRCVTDCFELLLNCHKVWPSRLVSGHPLSLPGDVSYWQILLRKPVERLRTVISVVLTRISIVP